MYDHISTTGGADIKLNICYIKVLTLLKSESLLSKREESFKLVTEDHKKIKINTLIWFSLAKIVYF